MRIIVVIGARPNFIKVGPLMPALAQAGHDASLVHTGQHYDSTMSEVFFRDLSLPEPRWYLNVGSGTHAVQTGTAMMRLEELLTQERPDSVIVVGDVNSTLAGALAAVKVGIPVIHLEAGLRSFDMSMPEEVNRLVADQLSAMHLAPGADAVGHLSREGVDARRIHFVGNIMAESLLRSMPQVDSRAVHQQHGLNSRGYVLSTIHRPENTDRPEALAQILGALESARLPVLLPAHPRTRELLAEHGAGKSESNVRVVDPVGYLDMLSLQRDAAAIVTDSGGVQEEACMLGTPCVTVRRNTERGVTIDVGANRLVDAERESVLAGLSDALEAPRGWVLPERWDDQVSTRVVEALSQGVMPLAGF